MLRKSLPKVCPGKIFYNDLLKLKMKKYPILKNPCLHFYVWNIAVSGIQEGLS